MVALCPSGTCARRARYAAVMDSDVRGFVCLLSFGVVLRCLVFLLTSAVSPSMFARAKQVARSERDAGEGPMVFGRGRPPQAPRRGVRRQEMVRAGRGRRARSHAQPLRQRRTRARVVQKHNHKRKGKEEGKDEGKARRAKSEKTQSLVFVIFISFALPALLPHAIQTPQLNANSRRA